MQAETSDNTQAYSPELTQKINAALDAMGDDYEPRTEHILADGSPQFTNRLILEDSPYLIQHAHNPVDWYAWSVEAFEKARRENKAIFLSIGYSTCHWCHVMERESFDNLEVARYMNDHFISIKVDRERRPDIDSTYMTAVQLISGRGGWPMSSFLTPDGKSFFGGTYYPPDQFMNLLKNVETAWRKDHDKLLQQADLISTEVQRHMATEKKGRFIGPAIIDLTVQQLLGRYDDLEGGFSTAPKFPNEAILFFLFDAAIRNRDKVAMDAVLHSLQAMAMGGIYDQLGGGFHRYATDPNWLVPHFEKMLYNQANLSRLYTKAYELTGDIIYARVTRQTLDYVLREMTPVHGGFYSATDADSEGQEGQFFVWTPDQIKAVLTQPEEAGLAIDIFAVTQAGNFESNNTILNLPISLRTYAEDKQLKLKDVMQRLDVVREKLLVARNKRIPPLRDDKIVVAWNSMMITALASAADGLHEKRYLDSAIRTANFIWAKLRNTDNSLWRSYLDGKVSVPASQEDYAYYAEALITLYDVTGDRLWLDRAELITEQMLNLFWDSDAYGFFMNAGNSDIPMMARPKEHFDSAIPSGNSVALRVLAKLLKRTGKFVYDDYVAKTIAAFSSSIAKSPGAYSYMMLAINEQLHQELGIHQYAARGNVITNMVFSVASDTDQLELILSLNIRPGWHINANKTLDKKLIPTQLLIKNMQSNWNITKVNYPEAIIKSLGFSETEFALFENKVEVKAYFKKEDKKIAEKLNIVPIQLKLQACNEELCLPPEVLNFNISPVIVRH
ncbi:MAG: thioredoxin domain-containing protein [Proteobacteria bacterium]|nr:thioredoxin domain-containing protein [Pseudomonadota bacterium]